jgi:trypsin
VYRYFSLTLSPLADVHLIPNSLLPLTPHNSHCAMGGGYDIIVGRHALDSTEGEVISVKAEVPHPEYNGLEHDFMLIFLIEAVAHDMEFVKLDSSIQLSNELLESDSTQLVVMGWGDTHESEEVQELSNELMEVDVRLITNEECEQSSDDMGNTYQGMIAESMMCAKDLGEDSCQGDSGGPLVMKSSQGADVQVGVVSWGYGCANEDFPGVYSRVSSAYDWIREVTCRRSVSPPAYFDCDNLELSPTMSPTSYPTYFPTKSPSPTASSRPSACMGNTENWVDVAGDGCDWYEKNDSPGCEATSALYEGEMGSAIDNCCYCFSNREDGGNLNDVAEDGTGVSIEISINISTEVVESALADLVDLVLPNHDDE